MDFRKLFKRKSWIAPLPTLTGIFTGGRVREFNTSEEQLEAYLGWVYLGADTRAARCAAIEVYLWNKKKSERVEEHPLLELLSRPNVIHNEKQFRKLFHLYRALTGEAYILKSQEESKGLPLALFPIPTHLGRFDMSGGFDNAYLEYNGKKYSTEQILRSIEPDPKNPYYGRGVVASAAGAVDEDMNSREFNQNFLANQARPSMMLNIKNTLDDSAKKRFKQELEAFHTGSQNAGKPLILEGDIDAKPYMLTHAEMEYLNSRKWSKDEILAMFKVSPGMVGMTENVNRSNMDAADLLFAKNVVIDELDAYVDMLNTQLLKDTTLEFRYENPVPEDLEYRLKMYDKGVGRWITPNEAREELGYDDILGGDELKREVIIPPDNTKDFDEIKTQIKALKDEESKKKLHGRLYSSPEEREELGVTLTAVREKRLQGFESQFIVVARELFDEIKKDVLKRLNSQKKLFKKKGVNDFLPDKQKYVKLAITLMSPVYEDLVKREVALAYLLATGSTDFDINDPDITEFLEKRTKLVAGSVNDTIEKDLRASLSEGLKNKETVAELTARIETILGLGSQARAQRIARTESVKTASESNIIAWNQSGVVVAKEWGAFEDNRTCPYCQGLDGNVIPLNDNYFNKGEVYEVDGQVLKLDFEAVNAPPVHASCRCVLLPILEES